MHKTAPGFVVGHQCLCVGFGNFSPSKETFRDRRRGRMDALDLERPSWLQSALDSGLVQIIKQSRVRGINSVSLPKEQYECSTPCKWRFTGDTNEAQYNRHVKTAAAHLGKALVFGKSITAACGTVFSSSSSSTRPQSASSSASARASTHAPFHAHALEALATAVALNERRQAELEIELSPTHAAAVLESTRAAASREQDEAAARVLQGPMTRIVEAQRSERAQTSNTQLEGMHRYATLSAAQFGQRAAETLERIKRCAALDAEQLSLRSADDLERVRRQVAHHSKQLRALQTAELEHGRHAAALDLERLRALHSEHTLASQAGLAMVTAKAQLAVADARRQQAEVQIQILAMRYAAMQVTAQAALLEAEQSAQQQDTELAAAFLCLHDYKCAG